MAANLKPNQIQNSPAHAARKPTKFAPEITFGAEGKSMAERSVGTRSRPNEAKAPDPAITFGAEGSSPAERSNGTRSRSRFNPVQLGFRNLDARPGRPRMAHSHGRTIYAPHRWARRRRKHRVTNLFLFDDVFSRKNESNLISNNLQDSNNKAVSTPPSNQNSKNTIHRNQKTKTQSRSQ